MRIFLSYSSHDRALVEPVHLALSAQGHDVFFDREDLPPGEEYDIRIRHAIERSHLFVCMVSPSSLDAGSYTLTELEIAEKTWPRPSGRVLPVILRSVEFDRIPPYLKAVTVLQPGGNVAADVADAVHRVFVEWRRARLKIFAIGAAAIVVVLAAGWGSWMYWESRGSIGKDGAPTLLVPAGNFVMGDDEESPLREIYVDAFYLDQYEVTTSRFAKFLQATGSVRPPEYWEDADLQHNGDLPVVGVDWRDADAYCKWAGKRLPTEAEWEKAARGTDQRLYPWGNNEPTAERANFGKTAKGPYAGGLAAVGTHPTGKSPYGLQDLAGNAAEWTADWFSESFPHSDVRNPKGPESGTGKVIRGGGWYDPAERLKSTKRFFAGPDHRSDDVGFRCARDLR